MHQGFFFLSGVLKWGVQEEKDQNLANKEEKGGDLYGKELTYMKMVRVDRMGLRGMAP